MTSLPEATGRRLGLVIDLDTCVGCHACAVNCKVVPGHTVVSFIAVTVSTGGSLMSTVPVTEQALGAVTCTV